MAKILLPDQQEFDLEDEIAASDDTLRASLSPYYPDLANCNIARKKTGDVLTVTVTKRAGTKGSPDSGSPDSGGPLDVLIAAPESINPAISMNRELLELEAKGALSAAGLLSRAPEIDRAIELGRKQINQVARAKRTLEEAEACAARVAPVGF